ncbi:YycH family regulatory protein [Gracilibacillus marinus]|uniref:YycH family regulatory protein n=1 Tax=Gracilibacillus marinus TaxID=630535 RepID=A0ABV8VYD9_9BACI
MNIEFIKTIVLYFLVGLSLLLTVAIWNFQGNYNYEGVENPTSDAQLGGVEISKQEIIQPDQIIFHWNNVAQGLEDKTKELNVFRDITDLRLYNFRIAEESAVIDEAVNRVEIKFPTSMPSSFINDIFTIDEQILIDSEFDSIILYLNEDRTNNHVVFNNSDPYAIDILANIQNLPQIISYFDQLNVVEQFITYLPVELRFNRTIYIPNEVKLNGKKFSYTSINPDANSLQSIFFWNPSNVKSSTNPDGGKTYSDSSREMVVKGYAMEYTNFFTAEKSTIDSSENAREGNLGEQVFTNAINYVNYHKGWLVEEGIDYRLSDLNPLLQEVEFRMIYKNHPVFSNQGLATMFMKFHDLSLYQYARPLMKLTQSYDRAETNLMSGEQLVDYLEQNEMYELDQILDIQLGYRIEQQAGAQVFDLIPTWCVETVQGWQMITSEMSMSNYQGGYGNAMGAN